ncbi:MAG: hypothetical protein M3680_05900 [Myxococcota bacterium]|nr:hypothetical protein [Myxococcota bacterium]
MLHLRIVDARGKHHVKLWPTLVFLRDARRSRASCVRPSGVEAIRHALAQLGT